MVVERRALAHALLVDGGRDADGHGAERVQQACQTIGGPPWCADGRAPAPRAPRKEGVAPVVAVEQAPVIDWEDEILRVVEAAAAAQPVEVPDGVVVIGTDRTQPDFGAIPGSTAARRSRATDRDAWTSRRACSCARCRRGRSRRAGIPPGEGQGARPARLRVALARRSTRRLKITARPVAPRRIDVSA